LGATLPNPCGFVLQVIQKTANLQPEFASNADIYVLYFL